MSLQRPKVRPERDYKIICQDPDHFFMVDLVNDSLYTWIVTFDGPKDTPYEGLKIRVSVKLPENYPIGIPELTFMSRILHPNVWVNGTICLDTLKPSNYSPSVTMEGVLTGLVSLLDDPNLSSPANHNASTIWQTKQKAVIKKAVNSYYRF